MHWNDLIMSLTAEQGPGRETQVQPPADVWAYFFGVYPSSRRGRSITLRNRTHGGRAIQIRRPVFHHHVTTIEVTGSDVPRPAIIHFHRIRNEKDCHEYDYWVYRPADIEFDHCVWILANFQNEFRKKGRGWLVI